MNSTKNPLPGCAAADFRASSGLIITIVKCRQLSDNDYTTALIVPFVAVVFFLFLIKFSWGGLITVGLSLKENLQ